MESAKDGQQQAWHMRHKQECAPAGAHRSTGKEQCSLKLLLYPLRHWMKIGFLNL